MNAIVSAKHKVVAVPDQPIFRQIFAGVFKEVTYNGNVMLLIPHGEQETVFLRNNGLDVPAPIVSQYDWEGGSPFGIQKLTAALMTTCPRAYVLNGMGTGKTKSALWAWRYLNRKSYAQKLLVLAPLSTLSFTWAREIFATLPGIKCQVLHGDKVKRLKRLADTDADIYIINHDGLEVIADALSHRTDIDALCIDELAVYRNGSANRTKLVRKIAARMKWVWGMTGSPTPNAPTDAWGQCTVVTPHTVPKYFGRFRDAVMTKVSDFRWASKPFALDHVYGVMQPAVRFTLDDVIELPDVVERTIDVELGTKQKQVYQVMEREAAVMYGTQQIDAMNAGAVLSKLLQISTGYVYTRNNEVVTLDNTDRLDTLVDHIQSSDNKVIVFAPFKHALEGIKSRLDQEGISNMVVSGDTPQGQRDTIFHAFQNTPEPRCIVAHPQCMSHGITLTAADTIIWFAPITSLETFEQANARIRRIGQKHKQLVLMLQGTKAERQMYALLRKKQKVQDMLLQMFAEGTDG